MSSQLNLENLSNREIKEFWEKTRNEQRKQQGLREAQARANADLGVDDEAPFWIDGFGNRIEGKKLDRKQPAITSMPTDTCRNWPRAKKCQNYPATAWSIG